MRVVAEKAEDLDIMDDPRPRDRVMWNRLKLVLEAELCNPAWGCKLYQMHREGFISLDAKRAGDKYHQIVLDFRKWQEVDPDQMIPEAREFVDNKIARVKRKYNECKEILKLRRKLVDMVVLDEEWPVFEAQKKEVANGLEALAIFFERGRTKGVRK